MKLGTAIPHRSQRFSKGLTLIELLTVVAILGLLAAVFIPNIASLSNGEVKETAFRRNAQEIASVFVTAQAAGLDFAAPGDDLEQTIRNIIAGGSPTDGPFRTKVYAVKGLTNADVVGVKKYLTLSGGNLSYHKTPST